jgi:hypothetical protein
LAGSSSQKFQSIQPNLSQDSCGLQPRHLICCCWTIPCPPYVINEWCFVVKQAPCGRSPIVSRDTSRWCLILLTYLFYHWLWYHLSG